MAYARNDGVSFGQIFQRMGLLAALLTVAAVALAAQLPQVNSGSSNLLQVYLSEYNTLTTRNTYLITLQYSLLPVLLIYVPLIAELRKRAMNPAKRELLTWGGFAGALVLAHLWAEDLWQQFNNIHYLETRLRPAVAALIPNQFWCYEPFLRNQRGTAFQWGEWGVPVTALIIFIILILDKQYEKRQAVSSESNMRIGWRRSLPWVFEVSGYVLCAYLIIALFFKIGATAELRLTMVSSIVCR